MAENLPKLMMVSDNEEFWLPRIVLIKNRRGYIAFTKSETMAELEDCEGTSAWKFAKEIEYE